MSRPCNFTAMIIEAGYDVAILIHPKLFAKRGARRKSGTWIVAMDEDLRFLYTAKVGGDATAPVLDRIPNIVKALTKYNDVWTVAHYVLAHLDTDLQGSFQSQQSNDYFVELHDLDDTLTQTAALADHKLLGVYVSSGEILCGTVPRYSFRDYAGLEHLPRAAVFSGPHGFSCTCGACTQHEEMLRRNREKYLLETGSDDQSR